LPDKVLDSLQLICFRQKSARHTLLIPPLFMQLLQTR
jgi:hypothetical protein